MSRISSHVYYVWKKRVQVSWNYNFSNQSPTANSIRVCVTLATNTSHISIKNTRQKYRKLARNNQNLNFATLHCRKMPQSVLSFFERSCSIFIYKCILFYFPPTEFLFSITGTCNTPWILQKSGLAIFFMSCITSLALMSSEQTWRGTSFS